MLAPNLYRPVQTVERFGSSYELRSYSSDVVSYTPVSDSSIPLHFLDEMAVHVARNGFLGVEDPAKWGYETKNIYHPDCRNSGMAHIFYHPERQEYLKIPVLMRRSHIQFFAMNALSQALEGSSDFDAVSANALIRNRRTGHTCLFFNAAEGIKAASHMITMRIEGSTIEEEATFKRDVRERTKELIFCLPRVLRPLCNDNPADYPYFSGNQGFDNAFLEASSTGDPRNARITLIDQAHPTLSQQLFNAVASRL